MLTRALTALGVVVLFTACPAPPDPKPDGGGMLPAPVLTSVAPATGPTSGGSTVILNGAQFVEGATAKFGSTTAFVSFVSAQKLSVTLPVASAAGAVAVTVTNPDGQSSTLANAFTYVTVSRTITEAMLLVPAERVVRTQGVSASVSVTAQVEIPNVTSVPGAGAGIRAQFGFAAMVSAEPRAADFTWADGTYSADSDGRMTGDRARDSYTATLALPSPGLANAQVFLLAARFSSDDGATWVLADRNGVMGGFTFDQLARVSVVSGSVDWCRLGGQQAEPPPELTVRTGSAPPTIYGQVYLLGVTDSSGQGAQLQGAIGYGDAGTAPETWNWSPATYNTDTGTGANDEYQATLPTSANGTFRFAFRFSHDGGAWTYCDADGLASDGFTEAQAGTLTVGAPTVQSCKVQAPSSLTSYEGRPSGTIYGRVFVPGLTEASGAGAGIEGQLGIGPSGSLPSASGWTWSSTTFNLDDSGGGEEYQATVTGPAAGTYAFAYRFRVNGGPWTECDLDASNNGVQVAQLGVLTALPFDVTQCQLEVANAVQTVLPGTTSQPFGFNVTVPTLTDATGQGVPLPVSIGLGAAGTDPSTWTQWTPATYVSDATAADRYTASLTAPTGLGTYQVAVRAQVGTRPVVYCDLDGSQNGYQSVQAGTLTVASAFIESCQLGSVSQFSMPSGDPLTVTARATVPGVSSQPGVSPNLRMEIGIGPVGDNASSSTLWGWAAATYSTEANGADEFSITRFPAYTGGRAVSARASLDGQTWTYCDLNGSNVGGYEVNQQYDVTVNPHTTFTYCNTQFPPNADGGMSIYGQLYHPGLTPDPSAPVVAQLGVGDETADPGFGWRWSNAAFNLIPSGQPNNNEYVGVLPVDAGIGRRYAFRYTVDAGVWCYGDFDGSQNGFSGGSNVGEIVP